MAGTQITIPDHVYTQALRIARERGLSVEEFLEKAVEEMSSTWHKTQKQTKQWEPPKGMNLGKPLIPEEEWTMATRDEI
jgi:hypothetical protein